MQQASLMAVIVSKLQGCTGTIELIQIRLSQQIQLRHQSYSCPQAPCNYALG